MLCFATRPTWCSPFKPTQGRRKWPSFTTVYADVVGTVTNQRGETLYTKTLTSVKGIQLDLLRATDAAYGKASEEMSDTFVPGLIRVWHGL